MQDGHPGTYVRLGHPPASRLGRRKVGPGCGAYDPGQVLDGLLEPPRRREGVGIGDRDVLPRLLHAQKAKPLSMLTPPPGEALGLLALAAGDRHLHFDGQEVTWELLMLVLRLVGAAPDIDTNTWASGRFPPFIRGAWGRVNLGEWALPPLPPERPRVRVG